MRVVRENVCKRSAALPCPHIAIPPPSSHQQQHDSPPSRSPRAPLKLTPWLPDSLAHDQVHTSPSLPARRQSTTSTPRTRPSHPQPSPAAPLPPAPHSLRHQQVHSSNCLLVVVEPKLECLDVRRVVCHYQRTLLEDHLTQIPAQLCECDGQDRGSAKTMCRVKRAE